MKSGFALALLLFSLVPCMVYSKDRGTVVDIWEQKDSYGHHFYIYQVETETHVYDFLGEPPQAFQPGNTISFVVDMRHRQARVSAGAKKLKLFLGGRGSKKAS
jgi:hypothetical protein